MDSPKKQALKDYIAAVGTGNAAGVRAVVTDDYEHEFLGTTVLRGKRPLPVILEQLELFTSAVVGPIQFTFQEVIEEGDVVAAMFSGKCQLANGKRFDGDYAVFCHYTGDKIRLMRELIDTKLADEVLV